MPLKGRKKAAKTNKGRKSKGGGNLNSWMVGRPPEEWTEWAKEVDTIKKLIDRELTKKKKLG